MEKYEDRHPFISLVLLRPVRYFVGPKLGISEFKDFSLCNFVHVIKFIDIYICDFMKLLIPNEVFLGAEQENAAVTTWACLYFWFVLGLINT